MAEHLEFALQLPNGYRLAGIRWGRETGNPDKEKVLALHGWLDNAATWDGLAPHLARRGMTVICLDFLGHGKSDHQQDAEYFLLTHVTSIISAVKVIGWTSFILMGHSMGGAISTAVAATIPSYIKSLVLVEGLGEWPSSLTALQCLQQGIESRAESYYNRHPKIYPDVISAINKLRENNKNLAEHSAKIIVRRNLVKVQDGYSFSHDPRLVARPLFRFSEADTRSFIKGIQCPTLVIWTKKSLNSYARTKMGEKTLEEMFAVRFSLLNPQSTIVILDEGSHHVHLDQPDLVLGHLLKFLNLDLAKM